jgi:hypothetical protein
LGPRAIILLFLNIIEGNFTIAEERSLREIDRKYYMPDEGRSGRRSAGD